jgi:Tfp pilus assembly PilM family ATPase
VAILSQFPSLPGLSLREANRLIAIDAGSHSIKILLVEKWRGEIKVLRQEILNLQEEKLLSSEEIGRSLGPLLESMGEYPIALALPQNVPLSQVLDLSAASQGVKQLIEAETLKNRDLRDSAIVYDCARLKPFGRHQNSFWVTLSKEADIFKQVSRLSLNVEDVCEVVPSANVLALAYQQTNNSGQNVVLVDIGASSTLATLLVDGQVVHAATFAIGGNLVTETIATKKGGSMETAETLKQTKNLLSGTDAIPALAPVIDGWRAELERIVKDWLFENPELKFPISSFNVVLGGGGAAQPGLIDYLNRGGIFGFVPWPKYEGASACLTGRFAICYGTALQTLGDKPHVGSLLPSALRTEWNQQRLQQRFLAATALFLVIIFFALAFGTWQKLSLINEKKELLAQTTLALKKAETMEGLEDEFTQKYERIRPVLRRQQQTLDLLNTLALLEKSRTNRSLWYVLFADQQSYFSGKTSIQPNRSEPAEPVEAKPGFIAELCLKEEGESMRTTLGQVVGELKQSPMFSSVDTLPIDLRKNLANPKVLIPNRHFALVLELAENTYQSSTHGKGSLATNAPSAAIPTAKDWEQSNVVVSEKF